MVRMASDRDVQDLADDTSCSIISCHLNQYGDLTQGELDLSTVFRYWDTCDVGASATASNYDLRWIHTKTFGMLLALDKN